MQTMALFSITCAKIPQACEHEWIKERVKPIEPLLASDSIFDTRQYSNFLHTFTVKYSSIIPSVIQSGSVNPLL